MCVCVCVLGMPGWFCKRFICFADLTGMRGGAILVDPTTTG